MPKNKVVCTGLPDLAFFGHEFHIIGIFGNFFVQICHFSKITLYFATDNDPDGTEFWNLLPRLKATSPKNKGHSIFWKR